MATNNRLRISNLDFDTVKTSLQNYLSSQSEFTDYNFQASGLSTILDVMAYNTHYQALIANFLANEMFLDTAVKRSSIVSRSKELGYVPASARSAQATVSVTVTQPYDASAPTSLVLPAYTTFTGQIDNKTVLFTNTQSHSSTLAIVGSNAVYTFANIVVYEGVYTQNTATYSSTSYTTQVPNLSVDTTTLRTIVTNATSGISTEYQQQFNFLTIDSTSQVFFIQEGFSEYFEVYFGDGVVGFQPSDGDTILLQYLVTSGSAGNYATNFDIFDRSFAPSANATFAVTTVSTSTGGADRESTDVIKFKALNAYGTQNRAVIADDYKALIASSGINVKFVQTWGGEDNDPPLFGTIVACVQPVVGDVITANDKARLTALVQTKAVGNTKVQFVDPEYVDIAVTTKIVYDKSLLAVTTYVLESNVRSTIINYDNNVLSTFANVFRLSNLMSDIDATDSSILNNKTTIQLQKWYTPQFYTSQSFSFSFVNSVTNLSSSQFYVLGQTQPVNLQDDGLGNVNLIYTLAGKTIIVTPNIGTVNYVTGAVQINNLTVTSLIGANLQFNATPLSQDVVASKNVILRIQNVNINISSQADYS